MSADSLTSRCRRTALSVSAIGGYLLLFLVTAQAFAGTYAEAVSAYKAGDFQSAARQLRLLAEEPNADAQNMLAFMYHDGQGVPRNYVLAYMWFYIAASLYDPASQDFKDAMDARDLTAKLMTAAQIDEARAMARVCQARNYRNCDGTP